MEESKPCCERCGEVLRERVNGGYCGLCEDDMEESKPVEIAKLRAELGEIDIQRYDQDGGGIWYQLEIYRKGRPLQIVGVIYDNRIIAEGVAAIPAHLDELERLREEVRVRDIALGAEARLETAEARVKELEADLESESRWAKQYLEFEQQRTVERDALQAKLDAVRDALYGAHTDHLDYRDMRPKVEKALTIINGGGK